MRMKRWVYCLIAWFGVFLLCAEAKGAEVIQNPEKGLWRYSAEGLSIGIVRKTDDTPRVWYETEIQASPEQPLKTCITEGNKPGCRLVNPKKLAEENRLVLAITDDYCGYRIAQDNTVGISIRNGLVLGSKTRNSSRTRGWPNLDTLAVYADGSMQAHVCDAYTAEEYLAAGAANVFAFGPVLLSQGEINADVMAEDYYPYNEPRMAIGMIEPYHYVILTAEGRTDDSVGARLSWMAEKMLELGCTEALNLDGGGTAALIFMGEVLNRSEKNMRSVNSLIGFGER